MESSRQAMRVREAAVAGRFYPRSQVDLARQVASYLEAAVRVVPPGARAVLSPHAGYPCSGAVAARSIAALRPATRRHGAPDGTQDIRGADLGGQAMTNGRSDQASSEVGAPGTVYLVGPAHYVIVQGVVVSSADAFVTPLGEVEVDVEARDALLRLDGRYRVSDEAHRVEHSLEVQLPFVQAVLPGWRIVPMLTGEAVDVAGVSADLAAIMVDDPTSVIVASSDLSHYYPYAKAKQLDESVLEAVTRGDDAAVRACEACGREGLLSAMLAAGRLGWAPRTLAYANSGDTCGPRSEVVGYGSIAWYPTQDGPSPS